MIEFKKLYELIFRIIRRDFIDRTFKQFDYDDIKTIHYTKKNEIHMFHLRAKNSRYYDIEYNELLKTFKVRYHKRNEDETYTIHLNEVDVC